MSKKITLPSGATVTLKDPKTLRVKDRKKVVLASDSAQGDFSKALALGDALVAMLIEDWSLELPIPLISIDSLGELEMADYDYLVEETKEAQKALFPSLTETPESAKNPDSPFVNSKD